MKVILKILLVIISLPIFIIFILGLNIRFQFLNSNFWISAFEKGDVYSQVSNDLSSRVATKAIAEGGKAEDTTDIASLVSGENMKQFFEKNTVSFLNYANGKSKDVTVFIPFSNNLWDLSKEIKLTDLLSEYNIEIITPADLEAMSHFGVWSWMLTVTAFVLVALILVAGWALTGHGRHLVLPGIILSLSGSLFVSIYFVGQLVSKVITRDFVGSINIGKSIGAIIASPVILSTISIWFWSGVVAIIAGIFLFFIKKPANLKSK